MTLNITRVFFALFHLVLLISVPLRAHSQEEFFEVVSRNDPSAIYNYLEDLPEDEQFDLLNAPFENGLTVLHHAVIHLGDEYETGDSKEIKVDAAANVFYVLRKLGADFWEDLANETPVSLANKLGFKQVVKALEAPLPETCSDETDNDPNTICQFDFDEDLDD